MRLVKWLTKQVSHHLSHSSSIHETRKLVRKKRRRSISNLFSHFHKYLLSSIFTLKKRLHHTFSHNFFSLFVFIFRYKTVWIGWNYESYYKVISKKQHVSLIIRSAQFNFDKKNFGFQNKI